MRKDDFSLALNHIDYDLIEEYVFEKESLKRRAHQRRQLAHFARAAACFAVLCVIIVPIMLFGDKMTAIPPDNHGGENPPYVSTTPVYPENEGPASQKPGDSSDDGVMGPESSDPAELKYTYYFAYNGTEYICPFGTYDQSLEEALQTESIDPKHVGEHMGEVMVTDNNGQRGWYRLYRGDGSNLIIEIEGYYMIAYRK